MKRFPACRIAILCLVFTTLSPCLWPQGIVAESTARARVSIHPGPAAVTRIDSRPFQFGENINFISLLRVPVRVLNSTVRLTASSTAH